jgi:c-di-GMP-binding flagellar brake protein YcgR
MVFLVIFVVLGGIFLFIYNSRNGGGLPGVQGDWIQFYVKGKDSGFSFREIELLRKLAQKTDMEDPSALFWSQDALTRCIKTLIKNTKESGEHKDPETQEFLSKLYDYRKKIELEKPKSLQGLNNTRELSEGQRLRVLIAGTGVFGSAIVKITRDYITITRPQGENLPQSYRWKGSRISLYFWRNEDAGYVFDTDVMDEVYSRGIPALQIRHSDQVFRTQKRKAARIKTHLPAFLYLMADGQVTDNIETSRGLRCIIEDLSETGCALSIGGKTAPGLRIKVQFEMDGDPLVMCGTVRSVDYREAENRSVLHVEAEQVPLTTRNHILAELFGMNMTEEELPFRIPDGASGVPDSLAGLENGDLEPGLDPPGLPRLDEGEGSGAPFQDIP